MEAWTLKVKHSHRGIKFGIAPNSPDDEERKLAVGGGVGFKTEHRHRGMKFGFALHSVDNWVQALPAGGGDGSRTRVRKPLDTTFFVGSLSFRIPYHERRQTGFRSR